MDGAVHSATAEQRRVGRIHDRVGRLLGDVAENQLDAGSGHLPARHVLVVPAAPIEGNPLRAIAPPGTRG